MERRLGDDHVDMDGPMARASPWSRFWFDWNKPLLRLGRTRPLEKNDLERWAARVDRSRFNRDYIEGLYQAEKERVVAAAAAINILRRGESCSTRSPSLAQAVARDFFHTTWLSRSLIMVNSLAKIGQAMALGLLLDTFEKEEETDDPKSSASSKEESSLFETLTSSGYFWAAVIISCGLITFPSKQHSFFQLYRKGAQYRTGLTAAIYAKTLRLPSIRQAHAATTTAGGNNNGNNSDKKNGGQNTSAKTGGGGGGGHVTNLASNDVERFVLTSIYANILLASPIEIIAILLVGIYTIGPVFACGYLLLFILVPMQYILSRRFVLLRSKIAAWTDARVHLVAQAVSGARVLKLQGWEKELEQKIASLRDREICQLARANGLKAWNDTIYYTSSLVVATAVLGLHVGAFHGTLTPRIVFTTFTLWNLLQYSVTKHIPHAIMGLSECYVACHRIQAFLDLPEASEGRGQQQQQEPTSGKASHENGATTNNNISSSVATKIRGAETETSTAPRDDNDESPLISLTNVTCYWDPSVTTTVGLKASQYVRNVALQDISLQFQSGTLYCVIGKVGSGKTALLQALIGELPIAKGRVTRSSPRSTDPHTLTMSYAAQDPWIMDGTAQENITMGLPFDAEWYGQIVRSCCLEADFAQFRRGDQTIVGDRGVQCSGGQKARLSLARAIYCNAQVLILDDPLSAVDAKVARTIYYDAIQDLCVRRGKCVVLVTHQHQFVGAPGNICILLKQGKLVCCGSFADCAAQSGGTIDEALQTESNDEKESNNSANPVNDPDPKEQETTVANIDTDAAFVEKRETGSIKRSTWGSYGEALGGPLVCGLFLFLFAATQGTFLITVFYVAKWGEAPATDQNSSAWFGLVYGLTVGTVCLAVIRSQLSFRLFLQASKRLHNQMLHTVLRATIEFYDTNPLGRILNRFAADVGISDELLPFTIYEFGVGFVMFVGSIITAIAILPLTLLVFPFLLWSFVRLKHVFVQTTRELKRLEGLGRSPIYAMLSESLTGVATIRTNNKTEYFRNKFEALHDGLISAQFGFIGVSRWFATQMDFLSFMFLATSTVCAVLVQDQGWLNLDPSVLGLALSLLLQLAGADFPFMVRLSAEVTNHMVSIERIWEFGHKVEQEAPLETALDRQHSDWPKVPSIAVSGLCARYRKNLPLCLHNVTFTIQPGERVGVVGRTGAGKTSLLQALFRVLEAEEGLIEIGGVDIAKLGLHKLRTSMAVITQAPVLFSGCTIRENLDPYPTAARKHDSTARIQEALESVHMWETIQSIHDGMDGIVADDGSNFSVGQRQLLCLARAIVADSRILVLDEATANVDTATDEILQRALRKRFAGATIIAIAHRLDTIMDYDKVLVLGNGRVLEYGSPSSLLENEKGQFYSMVESTGTAMSEALRRKVKTDAKESSAGAVHT